MLVYISGKFRRILPGNNLNCIYYAIIQSCVDCWVSTFEKHLNHFRKLQKRAARIVTQNLTAISGGSRGGRSGRAPPRSGCQKQKKRPDLGLNMLQNASFLRFHFFSGGSMPTGPSRAYETGCGLYKFLNKSAPPLPFVNSWIRHWR